MTDNFVHVKIMRDRQSFSLYISQGFPDQTSLREHCSGHSQELMCMKCLLTYDDAHSFAKHLHYKHAGESKACRLCRRRTWPHVYHFCADVGDAAACEVCDKEFGVLKPYRCWH